MSAKNIRFNKWVLEFDEELKRRTMLTWVDACGDPEPLNNYFNSNTSPAEAVTHFIEKYDLEDLTSGAWR